MTWQHFLIGWCIFLVLAYGIMLVEVMVYSKDVKDTLRRINEVLTEEEE